MIQSNAWCPGTGRNHVAASVVDPVKGAVDKSARQQTLERKHLRDPWDAGVLCDPEAAFEASASWTYSILRNLSNHNLCWIQFEVSHQKSGLLSIVTYAWCTSCTLSHENTRDGAILMIEHVQTWVKNYSLFGNHHADFQPQHQCAQCYWPSLQPVALPKIPVMRPENAPERQRPNSTRLSRTTRVCTSNAMAGIAVLWQQCLQLWRVPCLETFARSSRCGGYGQGTGCQLSAIKRFKIQDCNCFFQKRL